MSTVQPRHRPDSGRRRVMARPLRDGRPVTGSSHEPGLPRRRGRPVAAAALSVAALALIAVVGSWALNADRAPPAASAPPSQAAQASPSITAGGARSMRSSPSPSPRPSPSARPSVTGSPTASPTPGPDGAAPATAADFDLEGQVIEMGFPLRADTRYRYRDNFGNRRDGPADEYNHARPGPDGELIRLHDGIDIYARGGAPVLAPFDGVVLDPAERWQPWEPDRYGTTVAIVSDEPMSEGYAALLAHLDALWVEAGQEVRRGQVIGTVGQSGNAESTRAHVHFELRAPFLIDWGVVGEERSVDAFNPFPSLVAADSTR